MTRRFGLRLDPLDGLRCRDGAGVPTPGTLATALRGALFARHGTAAWIANAAFRGPWLAFAPPGGPTEPVVAMPANVTRVGDDRRPIRAEPLPAGRLPGWEHPDGQLPLWRLGDPVPGYLAADGLAAYLMDGTPPTSGQVVPASDLYALDARAGLVLKPDVALYAEILVGDDAPDEPLLSGPIPFGRGGRYVVVAEEPPFAWSEAPAAERSLWLMLSPGLFASTRPDRPDAPGLGQFRAAVSGPPLPVGERYAVPAGAVYYVEGATDLAGGSLCADAASVAAGWGFALRGVWNHAG